MSPGKTRRKRLCSRRSAAHPDGLTVVFCKLLHHLQRQKLQVKLTSSTWACVCCSLRLLVVLGGAGGAPPGAPSAPGAPGAPGAPAGAASGADLGEEDVKVRWE